MPDQGIAAHAAGQSRDEHCTMSHDQHIPIPAALLESMKSQRVVLFLGAGTSLDASGPASASAPSGARLRELLGRKFLGSDMPDYDLMSVAEMAIDAHSQAIVFEFIKTTLEAFEPSAAHRLVATFRWRAIATTNYDLLIQRAYASTPHRLQNLVTFVRDSEPVEDRLQQSSNPVMYLKLHGCLEQIHDPHLPPILSHEHYARYAANRTRLFNRFEGLASESPVLFCGYRLADPHIRNLIYKFTTGSRPRYYIVDPNISEQEKTYWAGKNVEVIAATFSRFMTSLDQAIPAIQRSIRITDVAIDQPIRRFYKVNAVESPRLREALQKDYTFLRQDLPHAPQDARRFYEGFDTGWGAIANRLDAKRRIVDDLLFKAILEETTTDARLFILKGPGGAGKTIALKRAAWDAATLDAVALWLEPTGALNLERLAELHQITGRRLYVFIDRIALHQDKVLSTVRAAKQRIIPITIIGAERDSEWNVYCQQLESLDPIEVRVGRLSPAEIEDLLDLLARHKSLGLLEGKSRREQIEAFTKGADRQLLVALHEATMGKSFEDIVHEEYLGIVPEQARQLYLDIVTMNQFAAPVRAGTISRISGIRFQDYQNDLLLPLQNVVLTSRDLYTGDFNYQARHARVAQLVFRRVCQSDEEKVAQLIRVLVGIDPGFSSDRLVLLSMTRGRKLAETISNPESGRAIYRAALAASSMNSLILQQWAIFESQHRNGSLADADELASRARAIEKNKAIIHTQAEIARKRANQEKSPLLKTQFRRQARERLDEMRPSNDRFRLSTNCKLLIDEVADLSADLDNDAPDRDVDAFTAKIKDAETALLRAGQLYPDDADIMQAVARLHEVLNQRISALRALERAFNAGPRGTGVAIRLAQAYADRNDETRALATLVQSLERNPDDKAVHLQIAKQMLRTANADNAAISGHLVRSYTNGDNNFDARQLHAQYLFKTGAMQEAMALFDQISQSAPREWRSSTPRHDSLISAILPRYSGHVVKRDLSFLFISTSVYPRDIYAPDDGSHDADWQAIESGAEVNFKVRFARNGPIAMDVKSGRLLLTRAA